MMFKHITLTVKIQLLVIGIFTIFRLLLFFTCRSFITDADSLSDILRSFWIGFRFDWVVASYIVLLPFLVLTVLTLAKSRSEMPVKVIFWLLFVVFSLTFVICAIDIPYFGYFFTRLNTAAFQWMDTPLLVAKMIVREFRYIGYLIPLILLNLAFFWGLKRIFSTFTRTQQRGNIWVSVALSLCAAWFLFMGVRGGNGLNKAPFRINDAFFGTNSFLNQLNLNANYTLFWSLRETSKESKTLHLMDNEEALQLVRNHFPSKRPTTARPFYAVSRRTQRTQRPPMWYLFSWKA